MAEEIASGTFAFKTELEDSHMNVESRLKELIGEPAGRLHTARSRNDQVATDFRLWVRDALDRLDADLLDLQRAAGAGREARRHDHAALPPPRSEERRGGKECVCTCDYRCCREIT